MKPSSRKEKLSSPTDRKMIEKSVGMSDIKPQLVRMLLVFSKKTGLWLFLFSFSFLSFFASGVLDSQDGLQYLAVSRQMYYTGEPTAPEYNYPEKNVHMNVNVGANGKTYSPTGAGYSLAMIPAVFLSDLLHKLYQVKPPEYFPLESDWSILLFASFINVFFASILVVVSFHFLQLLGVSHKNAVIFSLITVVATNLFPLAKHSFAHMMFITFLFMVFYGIKAYFSTKKMHFLVLSGLAYGLVIISYNPIFILAAPSIVLYYLLQSKPRLHLRWLSAQIKPVCVGVLSVLPFLLFYLAYNAIRTGTAVNSGYGIPVSNNFFVSQKILIEGVFGLLLSPGRGFFWYSPLFCLLIFYWFKIPWKKLLPECIAFGILSIVYIYFYAIQNSAGEWYQWNGESSWGPRYIALLIPFGMLFVTIIWQHLKRRSRWLVAFPIIVLSIASQSLGVLLPYQIKFHGLQAEFKLNGERFTTADYANFIPRYSPLVRMPRELAKRLKEFPGTINHGEYDIRLTDGVDFPFKLGNNQQWRRLRPQAFITYTDTSDNQARSFQIGLKNIQTASGSASPVLIQAIVDSQKVGAITLNSDSEGILSFSTNFPTGKHELLLEHQFMSTSSASIQQVYLTDMKINMKPVSIRTLDLFYVQPLAQTMTQAQYRYFGKKETDPWFYWHKRSEMYEGTLDLWWIKGMYYRDLPKQLFIGMFLGNSIIFAVSGSLLILKLTQVHHEQPAHPIADTVAKQNVSVVAPKSSFVSRRSGRKPGRSLR